jgi:acyl-CoA thioesterase FadM
VHVSADFSRALVFNEVVDVELAVLAVGRTSVEYALVITGDSGVAAAGTIKACFIDRATGRAVPWPDEVRERLSRGGLQAA